MSLRQPKIRSLANAGASSPVSRDLFVDQSLMRNMPCIGETVGWGVIGTIVASRSDLLSRFARWTYGRKIKLCTGLSANVILASEVILAHGLTQDEIDRWMESYRMGNLEALKVGYGKRRRPS
jgi:hypothetical protein